MDTAAQTQLETRPETGGALVQTIGPVAATIAAGGPVAGAVAILGLAGRGLIEALTGGNGADVPKTLLRFARSANAGTLTAPDFSAFLNLFSGAAVDAMTTSERAELRTILDYAAKTIGPAWKGWPYQRPELVASTPVPPPPAKPIELPKLYDPNAMRVRSFESYAIPGTLQHPGHFVDVAPRAWFELPPGQQFVTVTRPASIADIWNTPTATTTPAGGPQTREAVLARYAQAARPNWLWVAGAAALALFFWRL